MENLDLGLVCKIRQRTLGYPQELFECLDDGYIVLLLVVVAQKFWSLGIVT